MLGFIVNSTKPAFLGLVLFFLTAAGAHPMPNSILTLDVNTEKIYCTLELPLKELQLAVPFDVTQNPRILIKNHQQDLAYYILSHFRILGKNGQKWNMIINQISIAKSEQEAKGKYDDLVIALIIEPINTNTTRQFTICYDAIIHQVITHRAIVTIRQDWENGNVGENNIEIGTIGIDSNTLKVNPFKVNLAKGSNWKGFKSMVILGIKHIYEGTDHLLFLLVLLLTAPLLAANNRWIGSGGTKYALIRVLKIATAFTIGHSVTLIIGAFGLINPNIKPVEVLIALSIFFTAIHAIKPFFHNKEIYIAAGFGLIHGLAFAGILTGLNLNTHKLIISLLGFNIGIELMQLLVIVLVMPWLLLLSTHKVYQWIRIAGAVLAGIASLAWALERQTGKSNVIATLLQNSPIYSVWLVFGLACFTLLYTLFKKTV
jgi:hypothetical protein